MPAEFRGRCELNPKNLLRSRAALFSAVPTTTRCSTLALQCVVLAGCCGLFASTGGSWRTGSVVVVAALAALAADPGRRCDRSAHRLHWRAPGGGVAGR